MRKLDGRRYHVTDTYRRLCREPILKNERGQNRLYIVTTHDLNHEPLIPILEPTLLARRHGKRHWNRIVDSGTSWLARWGSEVTGNA